MSTDENKALVHRWLEARNSDNLNAALACWSDDKHEWLSQALDRFSAAFPDSQVTINETIAEGDQVAVLWTLHGTHRGDWRGIPATGNTVQWTGTDVYTVSDGKLNRLARAADNLALLKQLGVKAMWNDMVIG
jgi:steroid delta-isomerase-like uncharacterized protein